MNGGLMKRIRKSLGNEALEQRISELEKEATELRLRVADLDVRLTAWMRDMRGNVEAIRQEVAPTKAQQKRLKVQRGEK